MSQIAAIFGVSLVVGSESVIFHSPPAHLKFDSKKTVAVMPMQMFRADCSLGVKNHAKVPGAGMTPDSLQPFTTVLKDGYYDVDCADDDMFLHGDKFGDNRHEYELGESSNVSIVHYAAHVVPEDRETMTPDVCFRFCRTVPDMGYFGIRNGNTCYCTPYYRSVEGDDSMCDVVCEGDGTRACGSKTKSSIFAMHACQNQAQLLSDSSGAMVAVQSVVDALTTALTDTSNGMQSAADSYQDIFGQKGDPAAANLMQTAKVRAGELAAVAVDAGKLSGKMTAAHSEASGMAQTDFSVASAMTAAEEVFERMEGLTADGAAASEDMHREVEEAHPDAAPAAIADQYYPVMYFVDKASENMPSTCGGTASHTPLVGNVSTCAGACNADIHECVGFSFFPTAGSLPSDDGLCFLMSGFKTVTYYSQCGSGQSAAVDPTQVKCMAKLSKFEGTSLAVDGTGKCKECFKEVTHADRCFV